MAARNCTSDLSRREGGEGAWGMDVEIAQNLFIHLAAAESYRGATQMGSFSCQGMSTDSVPRNRRKHDAVGVIIHLAEEEEGRGRVFCFRLWIIDHFTHRYINSSRLILTLRQAGAVMRTFQTA